MSNLMKQMNTISCEGIYTDLSNEDYHASPGLSNSKMNLLLPPHCPYSFRYQEDNIKHKDTDAFDLGTAVHTLCFEPDEFQKRFYRVHEVPKRTSNLGKEAHAAMVKAAGGRLILDAEEYKIAALMSSMVVSHRVWRELMKKAKEEGATPCIEHSLAWIDEDHGVMLRSRPDFFTQNIIIDLKTTKDSSPFAFSKAITEYAYHRQAALACDGLKRLTGRDYNNIVLFVVDKNPPHFVRCYVLKENAVQQGRYEYKKAAEIYAQCTLNNIWPGYPEVIEDIDIPAWAYRSFE